MTLTVFLVLATAFLAYANGANDNFKGVASLFGSRSANYWSALAWATVTTFAGSLASIFLAQGPANMAFRCRRHTFPLDRSSERAS